MIYDETKRIVATQAGEQAFDREMGSNYGASTPQPHGACIIEWNSHKPITLTLVPVLCERSSW